MIKIFLSKNKNSKILGIQQKKMAKEIKNKSCKVYKMKIQKWKGWTQVKTAKKKL